MIEQNVFDGEFNELDYNNVLPLISLTWRNVIEAQNWEDYNFWKDKLDKCHSILFKAVDKTRRHTRQTSEEYKNYRKTLPSYYKTTGNPIGRPKIRDENYRKEYNKAYYYNVVKPKRKLLKK